MSETSAKDFLRFQCTRNVTSLYKQFLVLIEDLPNIPDDTRRKIRKRVLDNGNDAIREMDEYFERFDITFKP